MLLAKTGEGQEHSWGFLGGVLPEAQGILPHPIARHGGAGTGKRQDGGDGAQNFDTPLYLQSVDERPQKHGSSEKESSRRNVGAVLGHELGERHQARGREKREEPHRANDERS